MKLCSVAVTVITSGLMAHAAGPQGSGPTAPEYYRAGSKAFVEQRFEAAIDALNQSLVLDGKQIGAVRLLGLSYQLAGQLDQAESKFKDATRLAPKDAEAWFYLGRLHYVRNFFDPALAALQTAVKHAPNDARIRECFALTLEASGDPAAAEREYQQAMRGDRKPETLALNYGALLLKLGRMAESEKLLAQAAERMPVFWQARFELAKLYDQTERFEAALKELKAALECAPKPEEAARTHGLMAVTYSRLGRHEEARLAAAAAEGR
jgi:Tfp pilus assembly protein PilF